MQLTALRVQHEVLVAARRAGYSAAAETAGFAQTPLARSFGVKQVAQQFRKKSN